MSTNDFNTCVFLLRGRPALWAAFFLSWWAELFLL